MNTSDRGSDKGKSWRVFAAFELPESLRARIAKQSERVREAVPEATASWSRPENIHLTMKFFGSVEPGRVPSLSKALARVAQESEAIKIIVSGTGVFPRPSRPQVLWIGISEESGALARLQQRLEDECALEGFPQEDRAFRPHLTIARIRKPQGAKPLAEAHLRTKFVPTEVVLKELVLFRSELSSNGSKYTPLSRHRLES